MCWPLALGVISSGVSKSFAQIILDKDHFYIQKLSMHISSMVAECADIQIVATVQNFPLRERENNC